jgi:hypothetical protein|uniref:Major capsid protein N-terminal domain-containing protein n=1 Tax=viral metagenome TaxID=1070528 RepID=A0A6C0LD25_9ZZZZ
MGGGLLQLVAYGAQDVYLTGNPQITFFKVVYRRHTNFAIEAIQQTFNGTPNFGNRVTCQISRNGDLIHRMYLAVVNYYSTQEVCPYFGLRLINYVEIEIGGQKIDKHYSHWMYVWNELSLPISKKEAYKKMVGANDKLATIGTDANTGANLYIPLEFWFCRNVGLALPLIALQYHEVKINILFETKENCKGTGDNISDLPSVSLWVDYIFLDTDERRRFAQLSHEYLIEQLQFTGTESVSSAASIKPKLSFNHPCKELVWFCSSDHSANTTDAQKGVVNNNWVNYSTKVNTYAADNTGLYNATSAIDSTNPVKSAKLVLNGNDRFAARPGSYFNLIQPYQHHENIPSNPGINVYSFALKPEEHQPSGTLNMSRIDTAVLNLDINQVDTYLSNNQFSKNLHVYAVNYNVLRILSGMGGLAYSN